MKLRVYTIEAVRNRGLQFLGTASLYNWKISVYILEVAV